MPDREIQLFNETIAWVKEDFNAKNIHTNFYKDNSPLVLKRTGFRKNKVATGMLLNLWRRKSNDPSLPYMLFQIAWFNNLFLLEIPQCKDGSAKPLNNLPILCSIIEAQSGKTIYLDCSGKDDRQHCYS